MTYFPERQACSSVTDLGLDTDFLRGGPAACTAQELTAAPGFKPLNTGKEIKQESGTAQVRQLPSVINTHLQE